MLHQLPEVSAPHPPHILHNFLPHLEKYGNTHLHIEELAADVAKWVQLNPVPWEKGEISMESIVKRIKQPTLQGVFQAVYEIRAAAEGASIWCCKSMQNVHYYTLLEKLDTPPLYLHLYRDGRDVALSFQKALVGPKHIYQLAQKWKADQEAALAIQKVVPPQRFMAIRYEDLIQKPKTVLSKICSVLNISFRENSMAYFQSEETLNTAISGEMWSNVKKPVIADNYNKFQKELSEDEIRLFELIAGNMLETLGYARCYPNTQWQLSAEEIEDFEQKNRELMQKARLKASAAELAKRHGQEQMKHELANRNHIVEL